MAEPENRLSALERDDAADGRPIHIYTSYVRKLRLALPLIVIMLVAVLLLWPKLKFEIKIPDVPSSINKTDLEQAATENRLLQAEYFAVDSEGRPFKIRAIEAIQEKQNPDGVLLRAPVGALDMQDGTVLSIRSEHGLYEQEKKRLTLMDNVVMTRNDGSEMRTRSLFIDIANGIAETTTPVEGETPEGTIKARGMLITGRGALTVFKGPATLVLTTNSSLDMRKENP